MVEHHAHTRAGEVKVASKGDFVVHYSTAQTITAIASLDPHSEPFLSGALVKPDFFDIISKFMNY